MANLVYRKSSTPSTNVITAFKGSPLTNDELDNNLFGIDAEVQTKAPINNAVFTGSTTIPNIITTGGTINSVSIGSTSQSSGSFTALTSSGNAAINGGSITSSATTFNLVNATATTVNFAGAATAVTIGATTGTTTIRNANLAITGSVAVGSGPAKFTLNSANGNTYVAGTLDVIGATALAGLTAGAGGFSSLSSSGTLGVDGASTLNSLGVTNLATLGSMAVTGSSTLSNNVTLQGTSTAATKYFKINNGASVDKFTVDSANGNTYVAGTLDVIGATALAGLTAGAGGFSSLSSSGNITVTGDIIPTAATFNLVNATATTVNFAGAGTAVNIGALTGTTTVKNALTVTGATTLNGDIAVTGNVNVGSSKFTVNGATGNTNVVGTLGVSESATFSNNVTLIGSSTAATEYFKIKDGASVDKFTVDSANGNTVVLGTLGVTNAITGSSLTSTASTGTAPLTVASTTKVSNLNVDRVDDISFITTSIASGGIPYVQSTATGNHVINFTSGAINTILASSGTGAPTWISPSGFSAGSSDTAVSINNSGTNNGDTFYQYSVTTNLTTTGSVTATVSSATGINPGMYIFGNPNVPSTAKVSSISGTTVTLSEAATGGTPGAPVVTSTTFYNTNRLNIAAANTILTSSGTAPQWVTPSTVTVGTASLATNISAGTAGQLLYQGGVNSTSKLAIGAANTILTSSGTAPQWSTSLSLGGILTVSGASALNSLGVTNLATLGSLSVTGAATFSNNVTLIGSSTAATEYFKINNGASVDKFTVDSATGNTVISGTLDVTGNTAVTGTLTHGGLVLGGETVDQLYTGSDATLVVTTSWVNTSVNFNELATGSYMVQVNTGTEYYTGIMSWYSEDINSALTDEIILHRASAGTPAEIASGNLFLKVERTDDGVSPNMTLQISSSIARASASYTYKFRRMI